MKTLSLKIKNPNQKCYNKIEQNQRSKQKFSFQTFIFPPAISKQKFSAKITKRG
jgi:hypothetical protein